MDTLAAFPTAPRTRPTSSSQGTPDIHATSSAPNHSTRAPPANPTPCREFAFQASRPIAHVLYKPSHGGITRLQVVRHPHDRLRTMARLLLATGIAATLTVSLLLAHRLHRQESIKSQTGLNQPAAIDELYVVELGGVPQKVLVRGSDKRNPLLLYLHGGPGDPFLAWARDHYRPLTDEFVVASWAQRGTAGSYQLGMASLTVEQMLADTQQLIVWLSERFDREGIFLMGGSWGTTLGAITASRHPERLIAYIARAQGVNNPEGIAYSLRWALEKAKADRNWEAVRELEELSGHSPRPGHSPEDQMVLGNWVRYYGAYSPEAMEDKSAVVFFARTYLLPMWFSPDLTLWDQMQVVISPLFGARVFEEASEVVVEDLVERIDVPVYVLQGRNDVATPTYLVERWFRNLHAPAGKQLMIFEHSAHNVASSEPDKFYHAITRARDEACRRTSRCSGPATARLD